MGNVPYVSLSYRLCSMRAAAVTRRRT